MNRGMAAADDGHHEDNDPGADHAFGVVSTSPRMPTAKANVLGVAREPRPELDGPEPLS